MKATLITGASGGIGEAFARKLAAKKHNLVLVARSEEKLQKLCDELMAKNEILAHYIVRDLNEMDADRKIFAEIERHNIEIDWLINNAGFGTSGDFAELSLETELEMIGLNIMALVALTHRFIQPMRAKKSGTIINVSSTASFQPVPFFATYAATKAFVTSFTEALAEENRVFGIKILALCPGATDTNFFNNADMKPNKMREMQTPEEVVETALRALDRGKSQVISGWSNYLTAHAASFAPNSIVTKFAAKMMRDRKNK